RLAPETRRGPPRQYPTDRSSPAPRRLLRRARSPWRPSANFPCRNRRRRLHSCGQRSFRRRNGARRTRIDFERGAQRARESLEYRIALVVCVDTAQVIDMQRHQGVIDEALEEFAHEIHVELADQGSGEIDMEFETRTPGEIDHDARQRFVER